MKKLIAVILVLLSTVVQAEPPWYVRVDFGGSPFTSRGYSAGGVTIDMSDVSIGGTLIVDGVVTFMTSVDIDGNALNSDGDLIITPGGGDTIFVGRVSIGNPATAPQALYVDSTSDNEITGLRVARNGITNQYIDIGTFNDGIINNVGFNKELILRNSSTTTGSILFQTQGINTRMTIGFDGDVVIGDGTNDLLIAADGFTTLAGTARAVLEMQHNALDLIGPGPGSPPAGPNLTGHTFTLDFSPTADEEVFTTMELPHNWAVGTDIKVNFHWAPIDNGVGTVTWGVETKIITPESGTLTEASVATQIVTDDTSGTTQDEFLESGLIIIDLSGASIGDFLALRIFRDADASEGDADDDYGSDAQLAAFHMKFIVDSFGTDEAW